MDARHRDVLIAIIREYVDSAEPVGSRVLTRRHFPTLSPATIRNVMAELEETGYLAQPHTSAGRVPTDKAYRFYVNSFPPAQAAEAPPAPGTLPTRRSGIDGFMERTSAHLSVATKLTGLLLAPPLQNTTLARVELIPLEEGDRALAVLVTDAGWVTARAVTLEPPRSADEVRSIGRELSRRFGGRTVEQIVDMESAPSDPLDTLHTRARAVTEQIVALLKGRTLYVSGAINMLDHPEFWDIETTRDLLRTFEQKERLADLMTVLAEGEGLRRQLDEKHDRLLRALADAENTRRRAQRERDEFAKYATESLLRDLIPVLDNLDRALDAARAAGTAANLVEGVELIQRELLKVLERAGVTRYSAVGQVFDPTRHEAIARVVNAQVAPNTVVSEQLAGYLLHDRVLRAALVAVAVAPDEDA